MPHVTHHHTSRRDGEKLVIHHHVPKGMTVVKRTDEKDGVRHVHFTFDEWGNLEKERK